MKNLFLVLILFCVTQAAFGLNTQNYVLKSNFEQEFRPANKSVFGGHVNIESAHSLKLEDSTGGESIGLKAPSTVATNKTFTFPDSYGNLDDCFSGDGAGVFSFLDCITPSSSDVLTNKTIDVDLNTITDIDNNEIKSLAGIDATKIGSGSSDNTEFEYLNGVTSYIQTQLNGKQSTLTNSAGLAGALSDETGSGFAMFGSGPLMYSPEISDYILYGEIATPSNPAANKHKCYFKTSDQLFYCLNSSGLEAQIGGGGLDTQGQSEGSPVTTTTLKVPANQLTTIGTDTRLIETDSENLLVNAGFEHSTIATGWTLATNNTLTATTTSANLYGASAQAGLLTTNATVAFNLKQNVTPVSGMANTQGTIEWAVNVPSGITDGQICSTVNDTVQNCVSAYNNGTFYPYKIPIVFGTAGQSAGVLFKTTATYASGAQTAIVEKATVKSGLDTIAFSQDTDWTTVSSPASYISNITVGNGSLSLLKKRQGDSLVLKFAYEQGSTSSITGAVTLTLPDSLTIDMNKMARATGNNELIGHLYPEDASIGASSSKDVFPVQISTTTIRFISEGSAISTTVPFTWATGDRFSGWVEVPISSWVSDSAQFLTGTTPQKASGYWGDASALCQPALGTTDDSTTFNKTVDTGGSDCPFTSNYGDWTSLTTTSSLGAYKYFSAGAVKVCIKGTHRINYNANNSGSQQRLVIRGCAGTTSTGCSSNDYIGFSVSNGNNVNTGTTIATFEDIKPFTTCFEGNLPSSGNYTFELLESTTDNANISANIIKPILEADGSGYRTLSIEGGNESASMVVSLTNIPKVPNQTGSIDIFSFNFGTTNATTVCSASPCSFLDQIGAAVTSVTRASTGAYTLNTVRTYLKLQCTPTNVAWVAQNRLTEGINCTNCSSAAFNTANTTFTIADAYGGMNCIGTY